MQAGAREPTPMPPLHGVHPEDDRETQALLDIIQGQMRAPSSVD